MNNREFKEVRLSLGLTQAEFATQLGLTRETVCRIERCAFPLSRRVSLCAAALSIPLICLLCTSAAAVDSCMVRVAAFGPA